MDIILIFTNKDSISSHIKFDYKFDFDNKHIDKLENKNWKFLIAYDGKNINDELLDNIESNSSIYVLHHKLPAKDVLKDLKNSLLNKRLKTIRFYPSDHEDKNTYHRLKDIWEIRSKLEELEKIFDSLKEKISIDDLFEAKLALLHRCLDIHVNITKDNIVTLPSINDIIDETAKVINHRAIMLGMKNGFLDVFIDYQKSKTQNHFASLVNMRNELLGE